MNLEALKIIGITLAWCAITLGVGWLTYLLGSGEALRRKCEFDKELMQKLIDEDYSTLSSNQINLLTICELNTHMHYSGPLEEYGALVAGKLIKILYHNTVSEFTTIKLTKRGGRVAKKIPLLKKAECLFVRARTTLKKLLQVCVNEEFPELLASSSEIVRHHVLEELKRRKQKDPVEKEERKRLINSL